MSCLLRGEVPPLCTACVRLTACGAQSPLYSVHVRVLKCVRTVRVYFTVHSLFRSSTHTPVATVLPSSVLKIGMVMGPRPPPPLPPRPPSLSHRPLPLSRVVLPCSVLPVVSLTETIYVVCVSVFSGADSNKRLLAHTKRERVFI